MSQNTQEGQEDIRNGTEILFDNYIKTTIYMTPSPQLRQDIYQGLERVVRAEYDASTPASVEDLTPEQVTAYSILEKMGLISLNGGFCLSTQQGSEVYASLDRGRTYRKKRKNS